MRAIGVGRGRRLRGTGSGRGRPRHGPVRDPGVRTASPGAALTKIDPGLAPLPDLPRTRSGMPGMTAYFGLLDVGKLARGRHGGRVGRRGRGRRDGRPDRQDQGRARGRHRGRAREVRDARRGLRLRRVPSTTRTSDVCAALKRALPEAGRRVLRQRRRRDPRRGAGPPRARTRVSCICGAVSQYNSHGAAEPAQLHVAAGQPREHAGLPRVRLRRPLRRGRPADGAAGWPRASSQSREDVVEGLDTFPETLPSCSRARTPASWC